MANEKLNADKEEARLIHRLVMAWTAAKDVVAQLEPLMRDLGLLKEDGSLDTDRILLVERASKG